MTDVEGLLVRRPATALITVTLAAALLAGCSSGSDAEADPSPSASSTAGDETSSEASPEDVAALEAVTVEGELGAAPTLTFEQPFQVSAPVARVDVEGDGATLADDQLIKIHYNAISGDDGTSLGSTWEEGTPEVLSLGDSGLIEALPAVLRGHKVGTRVLFAAPGAEATESSEAYPATLMAIEVVEALSSRAEGEAVAPVDGLPTVTLADDGAPTIAVPEGYAAPTTLVAQPLIKGAGAVVETGQTVVVQYTGTLTDNTVFDSSWENGAPFSTQIGVGSVVAGWDQGLVGQTVGSQVLLVIPSELGYGAEGSGTIPADAPLVFVVDILAAY